MGTVYLRHDKTILRYNYTFSFSFGFAQHACRPLAFARIFAGCAVYIIALGIPTEVLHIVGWAALTGVLAQPCFALGKLGVRYTASMLEQRMSCVEKRYVR